MQLWNGLGIRIQSALHISALDFGDKGKEGVMHRYLVLKMQMNSTKIHVAKFPNPEQKNLDFAMMVSF